MRINVKHIISKFISFVSSFKGPIRITLAAIIILSSCTGSKYSFKTKKEEIAMSIHEERDVIPLNDLEKQQIPDLSVRASRGLASMFSPIISMAIKGVTMLIKMEDAKYTASYEQSLTGLYFYDQLSKKGSFDPIGIQFKGFRIVRLAEVNPGVIDTTLYAEFEIDTSNIYKIANSSSFKLILKTLRVKYAKAKVPESHWYQPWSWGGTNEDNDKLNIDFEITFRANIASKDGSYSYDAPLGNFILPLRDIPLNPNDQTYHLYYNRIAGLPLLGSSFIVPRSFGYAINDKGELSPVYSQGEYSIQVKVVEGGKKKFISKIFGAGNGAMGELNK